MGALWLFGCCLNRLQGEGGGGGKAGRGMQGVGGREETCRGGRGGGLCWGWWRVVNRGRCWVLKKQGKERGGEEEGTMEHVRKSCETKSTNKTMTLEKMWPMLGGGSGGAGRGAGRGGGQEPRLSAGQGHRKAEDSYRVGGWAVSTPHPKKKRQSFQFDLDQILALPRSPLPLEAFLLGWRWLVPGAGSLSSARCCSGS